MDQANYYEKMEKNISDFKESRKFRNLFLNKIIILKL